MMRDAVVSIEQIELGERFRIDYGNVTELATSITKDGLIHPPTCHFRPDEPIPYLLLAGGRRMAAIKQLGWKEVPIHIFDHELTLPERRSIELAENVYRKDLDWAERARLSKEIDDLQKSVHGEKVSTSPDAEGWSKRDTATLMGRSPATVVQDIKLAEAMQVFPELSSCKDRKEAISRLNSMFNNYAMNEAAKQLSEQRATTPIEVQRRELVNAFAIRDFFDGCRDIADNSIDIIEIDPPYGINLQDKKKLDNSISVDEYNEVADTQYIPFIDHVLKQAYRMLKDGGWLIQWFGPEPWFEPIYGLIKRNGFACRRIPSIWTKGLGGQTMAPNIYLASTYEMFFYARKGDAIIKQPGRANNFIFPPVAPQRKSHPTERPIEMIQEVLKTFASQGDRVVIPFLGSGNTLLAASNLGMQAIGFELSQEYKDRYIIKVHNSRPGEYSSYT